MVPPRIRINSHARWSASSMTPRFARRCAPAGRIQASRFSWRAMTDQTVASYARAVGRLWPPRRCRPSHVSPTPATAPICPPRQAARREAEAGVPARVVAPPHAVERLVLVAARSGRGQPGLLSGLVRALSHWAGARSRSGNYVEHEVYLPLQIALALSFVVHHRPARAVPPAARGQRARRPVDDLYRVRDCR